MRTTARRVTVVLAVGALIGAAATPALAERFAGGDQDRAGTRTGSARAASHPVRGRRPPPVKPAGHEPPKVVWKYAKGAFTVPRGATRSEVLRFRLDHVPEGPGGPAALTLAVPPTLKGVLAADPALITALPGGWFALPVQLSGPVKGSPTKGAVTHAHGELRFLVNGRPIPTPLPVRVAFTAPSATAIPTRASAPTPDRIATGPGGQKLVKDEILVLVSWDAPDPDAVIRAVAKATGGVIQGAIPATRTYQVRFDRYAHGLSRKLLAAQAVEGVEFASPNLVADDPSTKVPDDPEWDSWSATPAGNNAAMESIDAPGAWDRTTGSSSVRIAVLDNDLDSTHTDLDDDIGFTAGRGTTTTGHGTHVAGTICAEGDNAKGVTGMMWDCDLRLFPRGADTATMQEAMYRAVDDGARVVNMSQQYVENGSTAAPTAATLEAARRTNRVFGRALLYAKRYGKDVLWVFAAGNETRDAKYASPAGLVNQFPENVITVGAVDSAGALASFSNRGDLVTVAAPGVDILSTLPRTCSWWGLFCDDHYGRMSGTSMAAPHVTGLAGLVMSAHPAKSAVEVKKCIVAGARTAVAGQPFKVVDAAAAVRCEGGLSLPPKVDVVLSLDLTGSMGGVLGKAKEQAGQVITDLRAASPGTDFRFAVTSYEDYPGTFDSTACGSTYQATYGSGADRPFRLNAPLTADPAAVTGAIDGLSLGNGDDGPEAYGRALWELGQADTGAALGFRADALKIVVNFGDNVPHDTDLNNGTDVVGGTLPPDTGRDPGRNGVVDCGPGGDDIDFQDGALVALRTAGVRLLQVDSSSDASISPYWQAWASRTGGAYTRLTPTDSRTLSEVVIDLLELAPSDPVL